MDARALRKAYGSRQALDGIDLYVRAGEVLGLLGPNGAGKTTLLGVLSGAMPCDSGEVRVGTGGHPAPPTDTNVRRGIGLAPQQVALYGQLTAAENLTFFGGLYGLGGAHLRQRVRYSLEMAGLWPRRHAKAATFSGGMSRRLNLAAAVVHEPRLLLLDEPTVGVDPHSREHLFRCIEGLRSGGMTVVYSTHYMEEAERLCDRVAIMDQGRMLALGTVPELVAAHGGEPLVGTELLERSMRLETVFLTLTGRMLRD